MITGAPAGGAGASSMYGRMVYGRMVSGRPNRFRYRVVRGLDGLGVPRQLARGGPLRIRLGLGGA
jgi:hypothetical protein